LTLKLIERKFVAYMRTLLSYRFSV